MQHHHHSLHNDSKYIYQYRGSHTKIKYELYHAWETCFIIRETQKHEPYIFKNQKMINKKKNKIKSRSSHHIALVTIFPISQHFFNYDSIWESYATFSEDPQQFLLHTVSHFSPRVVNYQRETWLMNKWNVWYSVYIGCGEKLLP